MFEPAIAGIILGPLFLFYGFKSWHLKRLIENTPTSKIRSIAMGLVEIYGTIHQPFNKFLTSPFANKECAYYKYSIEELKHSKNGQYWAQIKTGEQRTPFYLKDNTGEVLVDPQSATITMLSTYEKQLSTFTSAPPAIKQFCTRNNINLTNFFGFGRTLRFKETALAHNDKAYILGTADDNPHKEEATAQQGIEDVMIQKGKHGVYYISNQPEKTILQFMALKAYGGVYGGATIFLASAGYLLWTFGL